MLCSLAMYVVFFYQVMIWRIYFCFNLGMYISNIFKIKLLHIYRGSHIVMNNEFLNLWNFIVCRGGDILCSHSGFKRCVASISDPHRGRGWLFCFISQSILSKEGLPPSSRVCIFRQRRGPYSGFCCLRWRKRHYITNRDSSSRTQFWWRGAHLSRSRHVTSIFC